MVTTEDSDFSNMQELVKATQNVFYDVMTSKYNLKGGLLLFSYVVLFVFLYFKFVITT